MLFAASGFYHTQLKQGKPSAVENVANTAM